MAEPPSPTPTIGAHQVVVVGADEQSDVAVDVDRWTGLAREVLLAEGVARRADPDLRRPRRDRRPQRRAHGHAGTDRRAVVPARRWAVPRNQACRCCSAMSSCARPSPPTRPPTTPARSTTSWPCSSCTACSTSSATTMPSRTRRRSCGREGARAPRAPALGRTGAGRLPPGTTSATKATVDAGGDLHGQRRAPARHDRRPARAARPPGGRRDGDQPDQPAQGRGHRPRRPQPRPSAACGSSRSRRSSSTRCC